MRRSSHGGRHELGQNFLNHKPTTDHIARLAAGTSGAILEIGAGDGTLTRALAALDRPLSVIEIDEHHVRKLRKSLPRVRIEQGDALRHPFSVPVVVGNIPFHITTPILRRLLAKGNWRQAILLTQWEVARKRAGVGGGTMMTAQAAPWFTFDLHGRVPSWHFTPRPSVDGGILGISRRESPLVPPHERVRYETFVRAVFTGRGRSLVGIVQRAGRLSANETRRTLQQAGIDNRRLPRDLNAQQWASIWAAVRR